MMPLYAINLDAAKLFVDLPFLVFSNLEFVMIYVCFNLNECIFIFVKKKYKKKMLDNKFFMLKHQFSACNVIRVKGKEWLIIIIQPFQNKL
jgi:hypothetical protein